MLTTELAVPTLASLNSQSTSNIRLLIVNFRYRLDIIDDDVGIGLFANIARYLKCPLGQAGVVTVLPQTCPASEYLAKILARALDETGIGTLQPRSKRKSYHRHQPLDQARLIPLHQFFPISSDNVVQESRREAEGGSGEGAAGMPLTELTNLTGAGTVYYDLTDVSYQLLANKLLKVAGLQGNDNLLAGLTILDTIVVIPPVAEALGLPLGQKLARLLRELDPFVTVGQLTQTKPRLRLEAFD